jgi:alkylglycerol monooxygenase
MLQLSALLIPLIFVIVWLDYRRCAKLGINAYHPLRNIANISIGVSEQITALVSMATVYIWIDWLYGFTPFHWPNHWLTWVVLFFFADFCFYWQHRISHETNFFWANHVPHHQSEDYNLLVGLRLGNLQFLARYIFWAPLPLFGFKLEWIISIHIIGGLYQWLLHTRTVGKLGVLEYFLMTPSQHRVHHAKNEQYIDKNYGSTFCIWDRMFGTFAAENEEVRFGIKSPWRDDNPFMASFQLYADTWNTAKKFKKPWDKVLIWIKPPGWLPKDSSYDYWHGSKIDNSMPSLCPALSTYTHTQLTISLLYFIIYYIYFKTLPLTFCWIAGIWLLLSVLNCGYLVSRSKNSQNLELIRMVALFYLSVCFFKLHPFFAFNGIIHSIASVFWIFKMHRKEVFLEH